MFFPIFRNRKKIKNKPAHNQGFSIVTLRKSPKNCKNMKLFTIFPLLALVLWCCTSVHLVNGKMYQNPFLDSKLGSRKIYSNDELVLWEVILSPGETTNLHTHHKNYVFYVQEGSKLDLFDKNDKKIISFDCRKDSFFDMRKTEDGKEFVAKHDPTLRFPSCHWVKNVGKSQFKEFIIEHK